MRDTQTRDRSRGATLVEYALGVGLVCVASIGALGALQDSGTDELDGRGNSIGNPTEVGITSSTTTPGSTSTSSSSTTTTAPFSVAVTTDCNGTGGDKNTCTFNLSPTPGSGAVIVWKIDPNTGFTGTLPTVTFTSEGNRTIQATVDGQDAQPITVTCKTTGTNMHCSQK